MSKRLILPEEALKSVYKRFWGTFAKQKELMLRDIKLPWSKPLGGLSGSHTIARLSEHRQFVDRWREFSHADLVQWRQVNRQSIGTIKVPERITLSSTEEVLACLPNETQKIFEHREYVINELAQGLIESFGSLDPRGLINALCDFDTLDKAKPQWCCDFLAIIPQLSRGMGEGLYLRTLPIEHGHTKFIEQNMRFIERVLDFIHQGEVADHGGLLSWLGASETPKGWLYLRGLSPSVRHQLMGLDLVSVDQTSLSNLDIKVRNVLIVENLQSALTIPDIENTLVVTGTGNNLSWMAGSFLDNKRIAYWSDIDVEGLKFLADARDYRPNLTALMMSHAEWEAFSMYRSAGPNSIKSVPTSLLSHEITLFNELTNSAKPRLEQEFIHQDYLYDCIHAWASSHIIDGEPILEPPISQE